MKKFFNHKEAKNYLGEYLKDSIIKRVSEGYSTRDSIFHIKAIFESLLKDNYNNFKNVYKNSIEQRGYDISRVRMYNGSGYYYNPTFLNFVRENGKTENRDSAENRAFFLVGDEVVHLLQLTNLTATDFQDFIETNEDISGFLLELIYEYSVNTKNFKLAKQILSKFYFKKESSELVIESDNMMDYYPLLSSSILVKKIKPKQLRDTLANYLRSLNNSTCSHVFPIDHTINEEIINKYKKQIKNATVSMYETTKDIKEGHVNIFDILESNPATRKSFLKFENWDDIREFRKLKEKNEARLHEIIITHLNTEHRNGIRKNQFVRVYKKIKDEMEVDVFRLNPKLQTYVLLEEIS
jgi:hypothetical protein